jgi:mRNA-degrading endonuclease toxin of MazEF toxin-antitoxin module
MASAWTIALLIAATVTLSITAQQNQPNRFAVQDDLAGRHPELLNNDDFKRWLTNNQLGPWHETAPEGQTRTVIVQNAAGSRVFAATVAVDGSQVMRTADVDLTSTKQTRDQVRAAATDAKLQADRIVAIRPTVRFLPSAKAEVDWEIEVLTSPTLIQTYRFSGGKLTPQATRTIRRDPAEYSKTAGDKVKPAVADDMADNELHHLPAFGLEAAAWVQGATTVQEKARRIFDKVRTTYVYDGNIVHISEFTWADYLTRDRNGRHGICDEWAVVEISYLRSVNVPARLKFLIWTSSGKPVGHAALEYSDGGTWRHMDALWNAFNDPAVYRRSGANNVTVMDADYPLDSRYNGGAWGVPDVNGDGKLYPYGDFLINPAYPGNGRPGYSH